MKLACRTALWIALALGAAAQCPAAIVLTYCGYIGGGDYDIGWDVAVDSTGSAYVTGWTASTGSSFPVDVGPSLTYAGGMYDAFVAKVRADGTGLVYAGFIGGNLWDDSEGIGVDATGNAYVGGATFSTEATFPVRVGPDLTYNGGGFGPDLWDGWVAKVNMSGASLVYAGYIGGAAGDWVGGLAVNAIGNAFATGISTSAAATFPVKVGPDLTPNGLSDVWVAKVRGDGAGLLWAGYIGGSDSEYGYAIAVDGVGSPYVAGDTGSAGSFPIVVGPGSTYGGGSDAFVAKVAPNGTALVYSGYLGGGDEDAAYGVAVDVDGSAHASGRTASIEATFPVAVGPDLTYDGGRFDAFVVAVKPDGSGLEYAGYIGGDGYDQGARIAVDADRRAIVTGTTDSSETTFPVLLGPDLTYGGMGDAFVAEVSAGGAALVYAGYIGGDGGEQGQGVATDAAGAAYVTGSTASSEATLPVTVGPDVTFNGGYDVFVAKLPAPPVCPLLTNAIAALVAVKPAGSPDDAALSWQADAAALTYNLWYVLAKADIPYADQKDQPPAIGVAGCAAPAPASGPACTDQGAVPRGSPSVFFYQVRAFCDPTTEGP